MDSFEIVQGGLFGEDRKYQVKVSRTATARQVRMLVDNQNMERIMATLDKPKRVGEIAKEIELDPQTVGRLIAILRRRGEVIKAGEMTVFKDKTAALWKRSSG